MKPHVFSYAAPASVPEALTLLAEHGPECSVLAGGQSLVPMLNMRRARPSVVIDIGRRSELAEIVADGEGVRIGAMARQRAVERSELIRARAALVTLGLGHVAHSSIRNRGTVVGSLANADPAAELPAIAVALDAELVARSVRSTRVIPAGEFFRGPFRTSLEPDELLVAVRLPETTASYRAAFQELSPRHFTFPLIAVGAVLDVRNGIIHDARLALAGAGEVPVRARRAEATLRGAAPGRAAFEAAAEAVLSEIEPGGDHRATAAYRRRVAGVLTQRVLDQACR